MNDLKITVTAIDCCGLSEPHEKLIGVYAFAVANAFSTGPQTAHQGWWILTVGIQKCLVHPRLTTREFSDLMVPLELAGFAI